ncbi:MAG TPA: site-2 protease family protein [Chloroflexota bacterium]
MQPLITAENPLSSLPEPASRKNNRAGLGGVILAVVAKGAKAVSMVKVALVGASFGLYSVLFSWQFALIILISLFVHENGHIWAMKRCGMKTRGIYFIPFLGGAAVADEAFPSRSDEAFVAIMGPVWGLALAVAVAVLYVITGDSLWAAAAGWMAFINLFNLFPVNPLDGGRIVKSAAFSLGSWLGIAVMVAGFLGAIVFSIIFGYALLVFILFIGVAEFFGEVRARLRGLNQRPPMRKPEVAATLGCYLALGAALLWLMTLMQGEPGAGLALQMLHS